MIGRGKDASDKTLVRLKNGRDDGVFRLNYQNERKKVCHSFKWFGGANIRGIYDDRRSIYCHQRSQKNRSTFKKDRIYHRIKKANFQSKSILAAGRHDGDYQKSANGLTADNSKKSPVL